MVQITQFDAVVEQHAVTLPIESVRESDFAGGTSMDTVKVDAGRHGVTKSKVHLTFMRTGKRVWFPQRHGSILADGHVVARHRPHEHGIGELPAPSDRPTSPTGTLRTL